jgi:hypothetical protein
MKPLPRNALLIGGLLAWSALSYFLEIQWFHRPDETYFYLLQDLSFLPVQVLLVTLLLNQLLAWRERRALLHKLNMVIGIFFTEAGTPILRALAECDPDLQQLKRLWIEQNDWSEKALMSLQRTMARRSPRLLANPAVLRNLQDDLTRYRPFMLGLLENATLLEHDAFSDALWATLHLSEELTLRPDLNGLPEADLTHLAGDMSRAYTLLLRQWVAYVQHLRVDYPYIFSLVTRSNPFVPAAPPIIQ